MLPGIISFCFRLGLVLFDCSDRAASFASAALYADFFVDDVLGISSADCAYRTSSFAGSAHYTSISNSHDSFLLQMCVKPRWGLCSLCEFIIVWVFAKNK